MTLTKIVRQGGKVFIRFGKVEKEFNSAQEARAWAIEPIAIDTPEGQQRLLVRRWLRLNASADNPALIEGHSVTYDPTNESMAVN